MAVEPDGTVVEQRSPTPIGNTASVPAGTLVTAPAAPPTGPSEKAPVVAVNTTPKFQDAQFLLGLLVALYGMTMSVLTVIPETGPIQWRTIGPKIALIVIGAAIAYLRNVTNTVTRG